MSEVVFQSIAQAAGSTGLPKPLLQHWKRSGAPGFRGSRVYFMEALKWAAENDPATNIMFWMRVAEAKNTPPILDDDESEESCS
jgi:hypothetical protein